MLNQRVEASDPFVSKATWESNGAPAGDLTGRKIYVGLDLSSLALAAELRAARRRLNALRAQLAPVDRYPAAPLPHLEPHRKGSGLPAVPGIYFLWHGDVVEYVGKSRCLSERVRLGPHHVLKHYHRISLLPWEESELAWAECYYIGVLRPAANFGANW